MTKEKFIRLGSWILMLTGLSMAVMYLSGLSSDPFSKPQAYQAFQYWYWLGFPGLIALGFAAIRIKFIDELGPLGNFALLLGVAFGVVGFAPMLISLLFDKDPNMQLLGLNFRIMRYVMVFFGIDVLRQHYLPKWRFLPLITGLVPLVISSLLSDFYLAWPRAFWPFYRPLFYFPVVFAIGTFLIGYLLQSKTKSAQQVT